MWHLSVLIISLTFMLTTDSLAPLEEARSAGIHGALVDTL